jgi:tRNA U38,U39,U40 pseudouridine synthase TruA
MDLPMAPSLGLYLGELFFDGYNAKQRKEMANDKRLAAIRAEKKAATAAAPGERL